jgi:uncharacterized protein
MNTVPDFEFDRRRRIDDLSTLISVFKVTERCNLECSYCYFFYGGDESYKVHPPIAPDETVDGMVRFFLAAIEDKGIRNLTISFHGGEPLLLKKDRFARICEQFIEGLGSRCNLTLGMQTNGVLIDEEWVELFVKYGLRLGVSFDGPPEFHDTTRIDKSGKGTYAETRRGWDLLMAAYHANRLHRPGVLCVVAPNQSGRVMFEHFAKDLGAKFIDFLPPEMNHDTLVLDRAHFKKCGDYLVDVCHAWFALGDNGICVRFLQRIIGPLISDEAARLTYASTGNHDYLMTISSNGAIAPDDTIRPIDERFVRTGLDVHRSSLADMLESDAWSEMARARAVLPTACRSCTWKNICVGGPLPTRFSRKRGFDNPTVYCDMLKRLYAYVARQLILGGYPKAQIEQRLAIDWDKTTTTKEEVTM